MEKLGFKKVMLTIKGKPIYKVWVKDGWKGFIKVEDNE